MTEAEEKKIVTAYSEGKIRREDMLDQLGLEYRFSEAIRLLAKHNLPFPRYPNASSPEAIKLLRELLKRRANDRQTS